MLRTIQLMACFGLFGLTLFGCGRAETTLGGAVTPDALQIAQEEDKKAQDAELAEQRRALQAAEPIR